MTEPFVWFVTFWACLPIGDAPVCDRFVLGPFPTEARCEINRPFVRTLLILDLEGVGFGAAIVDDGDCHPPGTAM